MDELTPIHFLAQLLNRADTEFIPVRWSALKKEKQAEYLKQATQAFEDWKTDELLMNEKRERFLMDAQTHYTDNVKDTDKG